MEYPHCGKSGLKLPRVSLGLWHNFGSKGNFDNMRDMCKTAFDNGITCFDIANNYGPEGGAAEENFGRILKKDLAPYRDQLVITSKAGYGMWPGPYGDNGSRKYLLASLDQSLKRTGLEYFDIFYHHRMDKETPLEESMGALDQAVKSGKALYAGISNYDLETTLKAAKILEDLHCPFIVNQVRYSIFDREIERTGLKEKAAKEGIGLVCFSPLAQGLLTDRYLNGIPEDSRMKTDGRFLNEKNLTPERMEQIKALNEIAKNRGQSLAQMALSWVLRDGDITSVLIGASKPEQILENVKIASKTDFTKEELAAIDKIAPAL
ncbi:MAG: aldo/keto reductase [Treponema sp.]|nr:aldo/keto reductase [Treponema sp.]